MPKTKKSVYSAHSPKTKKEINTLIDYIKDKAEFILDLIKKKFDEIKKSLIKRFIVISLVWFGAFFIFLGISQKLVEFFKFKPSTGLFIVGIILIAIALIYYAGSKK